MEGEEEIGRPRTGHNYVIYHTDREHRRVIRASGIILLPSDVVHHKDGNRRNNIIDNLEVMSRGDHIRLHFGIDKDEPRAHEHIPVICPACGREHPVEYRCTKRYNYTGRCKPCNGRLSGIHEEV